MKQKTSREYFPAVSHNHVENCLSIENLVCFDLNQIFDCGQSFRFHTISPGVWEGIAWGKWIRMSQSSDTLTLCPCSPEDYTGLWKHYLALDADYPSIQEDIIAHFGNDPTIRSAIALGNGIRVLRQEPWETICSFILSQNNNIPRIKSIISALCSSLGQPLGNGNYAFPSPQAIYSAGVDGLFSLHTGFRARYLFDAAQKVCSGELSLARLSSLPSPQLTNALESVCGIGPKVSGCISLFGFGRTEAFPIDVWMKRLITDYYPDGLNPAALGNYAGIAQQYLFYFVRKKSGMP